jgi:hypothetical protein
MKSPVLFMSIDRSFPVYKDTLVWAVRSYFIICSQLITESNKLYPNYMNDVSHSTVSSKL